MKNIPRHRSQPRAEGRCSFVSEYHPRKQIGCCIASKMNFQEASNRRDKNTYLDPFTFIQMMSDFFNADNNPPTSVREGTHRSAHPLHESSWHVYWANGTRTISPHRQPPQFVSFPHLSVIKKKRWRRRRKKRRCIYPELLICSLCFAVQRRWTTS